MNKLMLFAIIFIQAFICQGQNYVKFEAKGKVGFKDKTGKIVIPATFNRAWDQFSNGLVGVEKNKKWGYIDSSGKLVIPYKYDEVSEFLPVGLAMVYIGSLMGCIDVTGKVIVPVIYENGNLSFSKRNVFMATLKQKTGVLDQQGKIKIPFMYDDMQHLAGVGGGFYIVQKGGKFGTVDENNKQLIPIKYDLIERDWLHEQISRLKVKLNGKEGFIDLTGKEL